MIKNKNSAKKHIFFHIDLDAFYASVEQLDNPEYRGKPVIIGGEPHKRGVVSTCSYEARDFGVRSAMPMAKAVVLCPQGIFVRGRMQRYVEMSKKVMTVLKDFSPKVQQISIDEAFLDMTGTERLFGLPKETAQKIKTTVLHKTGLTVSIGVGTNKYIAKIASGIQKPDGLFIVASGKEQKFIRSLPLKDIWGVGKKSQERLIRAGFKTIKDFETCSIDLLKSILGEAGGKFLYTVLQGKDPGIFQEESASHSISSEQTFYNDLNKITDIETALLYLSEEIMYRLYNENVFSRTVHVKIRYHDFKTVSIQETQNTSISNANELYAIAKKLFFKKYEHGQAIRLLGIAACNVETKDTTQQLNLFNTDAEEKKKKVEKALFSLSQKTGKRIATKARLLQNIDKNSDKGKNP